MLVMIMIIQIVTYMFCAIWVRLFG